MADTPIDLDSLTPQDIAQIGSEYQVKMTGIVGTTIGRVLALGAYLLLVFGVSWFFVGILAIIAGLGDFDSWLLISAAWIFLVGVSYRLWLVNVPKLTALLTTNYLTKELHVFDTGLGIKYPWETYDPAQDYINLQADVAKEPKEFISKEGVPVTFEWSVQFSPYLRMLPLYVRTENQAIAEGFDEIISAILNAAVLKHGVEKLRDPVVLQEIREYLTRVLRGEVVEIEIEGGATPRVERISTLDSYDNTIEQRFALKTELATISPPKFRTDYQDLLMADVKTDKMRRQAQKFAAPEKDASGEVTWTGMSAEKATRQVMIMNNEPGVTDSAVTLQADERMERISENLKGVPGAVAGIAQGMARGAQALRPRSNRPQPGGGGQTRPQNPQDQGGSS